jgi:putative transcriptional regulator
MASLTGHLLIASPRMADPNFAQTVVLIVSHNPDGALGVVLNRPSDTTVAQVLQRRGKTCQRHETIHVGGPCHGPMTAVHTLTSLGRIHVLPGLFFTGDEEDVQSLLEQGDAAAVRFFVGYAGWDAGQLDAELRTGCWLISTASIDRVFDTGPHQWSRLTRSITSIANLWPKLVPPDPSVN